MTQVTIQPFGAREVGTAESKVIEFDWDTAGNLAVGATIVSSTFTITVERPASEETPGLTMDNDSILPGSRKTQVRVIQPTLGTRYRLNNTITTNESPAQIKEGSMFIDGVDK